jgi:hypothetical protein
MTTIELPLSASTYGREPARCVARVAQYDRGDRVRRAARVFFPLLGVGTVLVVVPPHVLTLAAFAIVASVLGARRLRERSEILSIDGACPDCAAPETLAVPRGLPAILPCAACGAFVKLEADDGPAAPSAPDALLASRRASGIP